MAGVVVALIAAMLKRQDTPSRPVSPQNTEASRAQQKADPTQPSRADPETDKQGWHPEESRHHRWERGYWGATTTLTLIAAVGAVWTVILSQGSLVESRKAVVEAHEQVVQAKRQADAAIIPYVFTSISNVSNIPMTDRFVDLNHAYLNVRIENFGGSPAIISHFKCGLFFGQGAHFANESIVDDSRIYDLPDFATTDDNEIVLTSKEPVKARCKFEGIINRHLFDFGEDKNIGHFFLYMEFSV